MDNVKNLRKKYEEEMLEQITGLVKKIKDSVA